MLRLLLSALFLLTFVSLLVYTVLLNPDTQSSLASQDPIVVNAITGCELKAQIANNEVTITLKNNHLETVTAFALGLGDTYRITEDFAYSEVHSGIAPGDTFEKRYHLPGSLTGSVPTLYLSSVLLDGGREEGDPLVAQKIRDERLGEKLQVFRTVRILERQRDLPKDLKILKHDVAAALKRCGI
ncbi:MAG TPA: hypothetical protein VGW76_13130 [Pyrinomonadaceae bacterium]|nr:hypothetical protein [Pyrinomonadaceae bacterium]